MLFDQIQKLLRSEKGNMILLFLLALVVRLIALDRIYLISRDGIHYVSLSQLYMSGSFLEGLSHPFHPLYPAIMAISGGLIGDVELAGKLISLTLSSLTVIPLYFIGKSIYDARVGFMGGVFYVFQPYSVRFSVDVLSDSTFLFFLVLSLFLGLKALREEKNHLWWSLGAGISGGLTYLTRPEGIIIIIFLIGWYLFGRIFNRKKELAKVFPITGVLLLSFSIIASPYIFFIKLHTGNWHISMKPSITKSLPVANLEKSCERPLPSFIPQIPKEVRDSPVVAPAKPKESFQGGDIWKSLTYPPLKFIETYHYLLFLFLLIGVWTGGRKNSKSQGGILLIFLMGYLLGLCYLYYTVSYVSRRHFLPLLTISLPLAGAGFWAVQKRLFAWTERFPNRWNREIALHTPVIIVLITLLILLPKALKPQGLDKLPLKEAALWIKENSGKPAPIIMSNEPLVAYYAEGKHCYIPGIGYGEFISYVQKNQVGYVVFGKREMEGGKQFLTQLRSNDFRKITLQNGQVLVCEVVR